MSTIERLQDIFRNIFDDDTLILNRETTAADIDEWDSLTQINIVEACETEFSVKFDLDDIVSLKDIGDMVDLIEEKMK